jgi:hypothetical protein
MPTRPASATRRRWKASAEERAACERLWADVAALMKKAEEKAK